MYYSLWFLGATCIAATVAALHPLYRSLAHITRNRRDGLEVLVGNYKKRLLRREGTARAKQMRREGSTDGEILDMLRQLAGSTTWISTRTETHNAHPLSLLSALQTVSPKNGLYNLRWVKHEQRKAKREHCEKRVYDFSISVSYINSFRP